MRNTLKYAAAYLLSASCLTLSTNALAWTNQINCEGGTTGSKVSESGTNQFSGTFSKTTYSSEQVGTGSLSCKMGVTKGTDGWGEFGASYRFPTKLVKGDQIWVRLNLFVPASFDTTTNTGVLKFMRVHTASSAGANQGYHDLLISNPGSTFWTDGKGEWTSSFIFNYEGKPGLQAVGARPTQDIVKGKWESYEMYVKLDSVSKNAGGTAQVKIWKNNTLLYTRTDESTLVDATSYADLFYLFTYWNGNAPATQSLYVDDVIFTNETPTNKDASGFPFIGGTLVTTISPPAAPALTIKTN